jgi:hypothetical protein
MTTKSELERRIEVLEDWHQKSWNSINIVNADITAINARLDGLIGVGSKMYTSLETRMTTKSELERRIESLEDWRSNVARVGADGAQGGSFELTALAERVAALERAQAAPASRYASSETFLEALTEQVAALRKMQAEPTNRQCVAEALLDAALAGYSYEDAAARLLEVSTSLNIYNSQGRTLRAMADVLERAARERGE